MNENFLTVRQLAEKLSVPLSWIYSRTRETGPDTMPRLKVGKYCRFDFNRVMDWLEKRSEEK